MKVFLKLGFIFDPQETTWEHLTQFDADLVKFLHEKGLEAEIVQTASGQEESMRIVYITKALGLSPTQSTETENREAIEETEEKTIK